MKTKKDKVLPVHKQGGYSYLLSTISEIIAQGRAKAVKAVDLIQVRTYWQIGRMIVEHEQGGKARAEYGEALIHRLSGDMIKRFGKGFSEINLRNMRRFYLEFSTKIQQTVSVKSFKSIYKLTLPTEKELHSLLRISKENK